MWQNKLEVRGGGSGKERRPRVFLEGSVNTEDVLLFRTHNPQERSKSEHKQQMLCPPGSRHPGNVKYEISPPPSQMGSSPRGRPLALSQLSSPCRHSQDRRLAWTGTDWPHRFQHLFTGPPSLSTSVVSSIFISICLRQWEVGGAG